MPRSRVARPQERAFLQRLGATLIRSATTGKGLENRWAQARGGSRPPPSAPRGTGFATPGRVVFEFVLDTAGRPAPATIRVVEATDPIFVAPARLALLFRHYRPALLQGHPVCVRIRQPVELHPPR